MADPKKPSERVLSNPYDGKEIVDKLGRKIRLRKPNVLDKYDLFSAIGEDVKSPVCLSYAIPLLHVATIDGMVVECPKSHKDFRATLQRVADEGIEAVSDFIAKVEEQNTEKEVSDKIKN